MTQNKSRALIIVDVQYDFLPRGALAVKDGDLIIPIINAVQQKFDRIVATQDFHPADHGSFASNHPGKSPGEFVELKGLSQILWPDHCVQHTKGSEFHKDLDQSKWEEVFEKGKDPLVDSYSGFFDNARKAKTGLGDYLKESGVKEVFICGLAQDYCVKFTALDAVSLGFETVLISDATKAVNLGPEDGEKALKEMAKAVVRFVKSTELDRELDK